MQLELHLRPFRVIVPNARIILIALLGLFGLFLGPSMVLSAGKKELPIQSINLPPGFTLSVYAGHVPKARSMVLGAQGTLFVGTRHAGKVYAIVNRGQDHTADEVITLARGLNTPNGVAFHNGALYVAETHRVIRFDEIEANLNEPPVPVVVNDQIPRHPQHGWKILRLGPDGWLYFPVGAPCNVCERDDAPFASILRMRPDGAALQPFARGVRNTVGFDWHPETRELWFTDNGADWIGNDLPPDELNHAPEAGRHFGFPYCHGANTPDPLFGKRRRCDEFTPAAIALGPHVAALGMRFYTGAMFPNDYRNQIFIAEHGSWNRTTPTGYRITRVHLEGNRAVAYDVLPTAGCRENRPGAVLWMCWSCPMAPFSCRMIAPMPSTASPTRPRRPSRQPIPNPKRPNPKRKITNPKFPWKNRRRVK